MNSHDLEEALERESTLRHHAEAIAEEKTRELVQANEELRRQADTLEETVRRRTAELANARDEALEANKAKSQFLANMSHELRTPLNAVIGYSEMLIEEAEEGGYTTILADLHKIHVAGNHLLGLINDILDLSKIEAGKMELFLETFDVAEMVHDVVATVTPLIEKSGNTLETYCDPHIGTMHADLTKVRQALFNLISNANKFTPKNGTLRLRALRVKRPSGQEWIEFDVIDSGIGMNDEQMARLFQPFSQADASTTRKYGGTGLGLTITRRFCEMMDGDIRVTSEPGRGSTFTIQLPVCVTGVRSRQEPRPPVPAAASCTVLVVDDDPVARELVRRFLIAEGYRVETAASGEEGLQKAHALRPNAITLDVMMPSMDGWSVLSMLKSSPDLCEIPVIMLTIVDEQNMGYALGAADYLTKPIDRARLVSVLERYRKGNGRVLLVEDDGPTRDLVRRTLEKQGMQVLEAHNGEAGLAQLTETTPDVVLLDLMMPVMDGFQFLAEMKRHPDWRAIPVVVVTAKELTEEDRRLLEGQVHSILQKCIYSREELLAEIRRQLGYSGNVPSAESK